MTKKDIVAVLCSCSGAAEAEAIASAIVESRLAACVNIIPAVQSVYRWQGKVESAAESLLVIKTTGDQFNALRDRILELHSYDLPEVIALPLVTGSEPYLDWIRENVDS